MWLYKKECKRKMKLFFQCYTLENLLTFCAFILKWFSCCLWESGQNMSLHPSAAGRPETRTELEPSWTLGFGPEEELRAH